MIHSTEVHGTGAAREQEYLLGWQRARADLANVRKRVVEEKVHEQARLKADVLESFLALADHFRALASHAPENLKEDIWAQGVLHIGREFERVLGEHGLEVINPENEMFNPVVHEAVEQVQEGKKDTVVGVVQVGYRVGEKVIRPAKVKVAK